MRTHLTQLVSLRHGIDSERVKQAITAEWQELSRFIDKSIKLSTASLSCCRAGLAGLSMLFETELSFSDIFDALEHRRRSWEG